jgi:hypothetical protein
MKFGITDLAVAFLIATATYGADAVAPDIADFTIVTGGHYQVLAQSGAGIGGQVNRFMNAMLQQYARYFSNWSMIDGARVVVFDNAEDFLAYSRPLVGMPSEGLAGYCHLKTDEDGNTFYELVTYDHENLWSTLAHEGFHQFLGYELGDDIPIWLNEGMAQYFETSYIENRRLHTGGVNRNKLFAAQRFLRTDQSPSLAELLVMDRATFYANARATYPMSWALVYYLMSRDGTSYKNSKFRRYLQDLKTNMDDVASFRRRFGRDTAQWEDDFRRYILSLQPPS